MIDRFPQFAPRSEADGLIEKECNHCHIMFRTNNDRALYCTEQHKAAAAFARHYARNRDAIINHVKEARKAKKTARP